MELGIVADSVSGRPIRTLLIGSTTPAGVPCSALEADSGINQYGWMEVWTEYRPGRGFSYEVVREEGYEYVLNKVLRGVLKGEAELLANGKPLRAALAARNYRFEDGGVTESGLARVLLHPNRKSEGIVLGSALIEPDAGSVVHRRTARQESVLLGA